MTRQATAAIAQVEDLQVAYDATDGCGLPVVFLHGLAEDRATWALQIATATSRPCFAYDLRGHGETSIGDANGTLQQLGRDLLAFLRLVSGPSTVVGFSLGGTIALWAAAHDDDGLILDVIAIGASSVVGRQAAEFYTQRIALAADPASPPFRDAVRHDTAAGLHVEHARLSEVTAARLAAIGDGQGYINAAIAMQALNETPLTPELARVQVPVHVVGGSDDAFCPMKASQIILESLSEADYIEVPSAGHLMNIDNPQGVAAVLTTTLRRDN